MPSFHPLSLPLSHVFHSPSYSRYHYCRCYSQISSQYGCWTWEEMIPAEWQKVKMRGKRVVGRESGGRTQIRSTGTGNRWSLLHLCTVHDEWEYLLSILQHQGSSIWIRRNSISFPYIHEHTIALTHIYTLTQGNTCKHSDKYLMVLGKPACISK